MDVSSTFCELKQADTVAVSLYLTLQTDGKKGVVTGPRRVVVVLDNSGSMSGSGISQAQQSINKLVAQLLSTDPKLLFSIISFNSYASLLYQGSDGTSITSTVNRIHATGGTSFQHAFDEITKHITANGRGEKENVSIIFFTDGCDGSAVAVRNASMGKLKEALEKHTAGAALHTIGFTAAPDARLLGDITSIGTTQGTFQYVSSAAQISEAVTSLIGLLNLKSSVVAKLTVSPKDAPTTVFLEKKVFFSESYADQFAATTFVPNGLVADSDNLFVVSVTMGDTKKDFTLNHTAPREDATMSQIVEYTTSYVSDSLMQLSQSLFGQTQPTKDKLIEAQSTVKGHDLLIQGLFDQLMKHKVRTEKKELMAQMEDVTAHIAEFHRALASGMANTLTNETIAKLNSLAYKKVAKRSLAKKLDQRVEENTLLFEKLETFISKAVAQLNAEKIKEKYQSAEIEAIGQCMLSCKNWLDAVMDSDCLCMAINVTRSEAAIADPTQVIVHSISPTFLTADSFLDSVEFALTKTGNSAEEAHGGFNRQATTPSVIVGQAREAISAVLPLYISDEHWSVAKHKMKPVMGWVTTLSVLGYAASQVKAIPFLAMATAARDAFNESAASFKKTQYNLIFETCKQIVKDFSQPGSEYNLANDLKAIFEKYCEDPKVRTVDVVANNWVFLMQLHCAIEVGLIERLAPANMEKFVLAVAEEELRRRPAPFVWNNTAAQLYQTVGEMFGIEESVYVTPIVTAYKEANSEIQKVRLQRITDFYEAKLTDLDEGRAAVLEEGAETIKDCVAFSPDVRDEIVKIEATVKVPEFTGKIDVLSPKANAIIADFEKAFSVNVAAMVQTANLLIMKKPNNNKTDFSALGTYEPLVWMALVVQNTLQFSNADRREAIEKGKYMDPFTHSQQILKTLHAQLVQELREKYMREYITEMMNEIQLKVATYQAKFKAFFGDLAAKWNSQAIELYYKLQPYKPLTHKEPVCSHCTHTKPGYAGFRCVCGCYDCFTSYYYDIAQKPE